MNDPTPSKLEQIAQDHSACLLAHTLTNAEFLSRYRDLCTRMDKLSEEDIQKVNRRSCYLVYQKQSTHNPRSTWRNPLP
jgi:hypothetical protein